MPSLAEVVSFLNSLYVDFGDGTGALKESPNVEATHIYTNTNYVALALLNLGGSSYTNAISAFLQKYDHEHYHRADLLIDPGSGTLPITTNTTITLGEVTVNGVTYSILAEVPTSTPYANPADYADIAIYTALIYLWHGDFANAIYWQQQAQRMWDNKGFRDVSFNGTYATYKLGLYYFLMRALRLNDSITAWIEEHIDDFKASSGGYYTGYDGNLNPVGDPNVETSSIVGLAFCTDYPLRFPLYVRQHYVEVSKGIIEGVEGAIDFGLGLAFIVGIIKKLREKLGY